MLHIQLQICVRDLSLCIHKTTTFSMDSMKLKLYFGHRHGFLTLFYLELCG